MLVGQFKPFRRQPRQHAEIGPQGRGLNPANTLLRCRVHNRMQQGASNTGAALCRGHPNRLQAQDGLRTAELTSQHACKQIPTQFVALAHGHLHMRAGITLRSGEPAFEVAATRESGQFSVDGDHGL